MRLLLPLLAAAYVQEDQWSFFGGPAPAKALALVGSADKTALSELNGLADAAHDLSQDEDHDAAALKAVDADLAKLTAKKVQLTSDAAKKKREIFLLKTEVSTLGKGLSSADLAAVVAREGAMAQAAAQADAQADMQAQAEAQAQAQAAAQAQAQAEAAAAQQAATEATARQAAAEAVAQKAAAEAAIQKAAAAEQAARAAQAAATSSSATQKAALSKATAQVVARRSAQQSHKAAASSESSVEDADSALDDTGLSDYLKGEDGADEENDPDYNDSANALADAIGWDRNKVESNADAAVKSLTEAIGGKKVVQQLQGMMGGLSAMSGR